MRHVSEKQNHDPIEMVDIYTVRNRGNTGNAGGQPESRAQHAHGYTGGKGGLSQAPKGRGRPKKRGTNPLLFRSLSVALSAAAVLVAFGLVLKGSFSESLPVESSGSRTASLTISSGGGQKEPSQRPAAGAAAGSSLGEPSSSQKPEPPSRENEGQGAVSKPEQGGKKEPASSQSGGNAPSKEQGTSSSAKPDSSSGASGEKGNAGNKQDPYPQLYVEKPEYVPHQEGDKVVYLTFDDGPSDYTIPLLDVLDRYGVKATFFDVGIHSETAEQAMKETVRRGHTLAVHSYTHDFHTIYQSTEAFLQDFKKERDYIHSVTGVEPTIFRFAGGSINSFNKQTAKGIIEEMERRGYTYYDWNVDSQDATGNNIPTQQIFNNVIGGVRGKEKAIVLMHNTNAKRTTLEILPDVIEELQRMGYRFDILDNTVEPINFRVPG